MMKLGSEEEVNDLYDLLGALEQWEHKQVWDVLLALGARVREEQVYPDALAVAHETMRRVRVNLELLIPRLHTIGYEFGYEWLRASDPHNASLAKWMAEQPAIYRV
jgi:hypothetical protein